MEEEITAQEQPNQADRLIKYRWKKGVSGNKNGRPISVIKKVKDKFREDPDTFDDWIGDYLEDKNNKKHIVEMIDGKPVQALTGKDGRDLIPDKLSIEKANKALLSFFKK